MTSSEPIRILVVDDHPLLRAGVAALIGTQPDMSIIGEATSGREAIESFRTLRPDVTLVDSAHDMLANHVEDGDAVVPPGYYFAMGDNRDSSLDSRYWGFVPRGNIIGKPLIIYWSYDATTDALTTIGIDHFWDLAKNFPTKTRWSRTFRLIRGYPLK